MESRKQRVVVIGASPNPERYSNRAVRLLMTHGHEVVPVHPAIPSIEGLSVVHQVEEITGSVDTVTFYVSAARSSAVAEALIGLAPRRVIFNPGAENPSLREILEQKGIQVEDACTLVLLNTNQF
jgi:predicted CoA-binding protein